MRRLWAHILIACAAIVAVFASFPALIKGISSNGEYVTRRQFTFQLTEIKDDEDKVVNELTNKSAKEMAKIMEQRLINYGVTSYDITTSGENSENGIDDIVTVSFNAESNEKYNQIVTYLTFSGSFALMNNQTDVVTADQFRNGAAYLKNVSVNEYPTVILPIKTGYTDWETLIDGAIKNPESEKTSEESEETTETAKVFVIYNYQKGDNYQTLSESNQLEKKLLLTFSFDPNDEASLYYDDNKNSLAQVCGYQDSNGNGYADANEVKSAYNQADYLVNLFGASSLDYEVKCIKGLASGTEVWLDPSVETIVSGGKIVWNSTLTACIAGLIIASLLLAIFYRLGAISTIVSTIVTVFGAFLFMVLAGMEYNALALVALVTVAALSFASGIIYLNKLKEDAYRGHTLKKANTEASKKSLLPIIDINFIAIVIGLMSYLLGGSALHSFGAILTFGGIVSIILNTIVLKGLMWLPTNTTALIGKYEYFGIDSKNVPNHMAEEKQRYYGPYADRDFTKKKKPVGIVALSAFVLGLVGVIVSASLNGGNLLKNGTSKALSNELYVQDTIKVLDTDSKSKLNETTLNDEILTVIEVDEKGNGEFKALSTYVSDTHYVNFVTSESITVEGTTTQYATTYYVVKLNKILDLSKPAKLKSEATSEYTLEGLLNSFFDAAPTSFDAKTTSISLKTTETTVKVSSPDWTKVMLATSIAVLIVTLYLMLRYRLARGLATLIFPVANAVIVLGLVALLSAIGIPVAANVTIALPVVTLLSYFFMVLYMNRERELVIDDKSRDTTYEHREELSRTALGMAYTPILATAVIGIYLLINFFGFGVMSSSYMYLIMILGSIIALGLVCVLYVPVSNWVYKLFSNVHINIKPRERKNKKAAVKKSAEPEEAIFIGIND